MLQRLSTALIFQMNELDAVRCSMTLPLFNRQMVDGDFPKLDVLFFGGGGSYNKDYSILGSPYLGKLADLQ